MQPKSSHLHSYHHGTSSSCCRSNREHTVWICSQMTLGPENEGAEHHRRPAGPAKGVYPQCNVSMTFGPLQVSSTEDKCWNDQRVHPLGGSETSPHGQIKDDSWELHLPLCKCQSACLCPQPEDHKCSREQIKPSRTKVFSLQPLKLSARYMLHWKYGGGRMLMWAFSAVTA